VIVPQATAGDDVELVIKGSKATRRLATKPEASLGVPPAPTPPAKDSPLSGIVFVIVLCAVIAVAFVFGGKFFKPAGNQAGGQANQVTTTSNEEKTPPSASSKPILGLTSVIFGKGDSLVLNSGTAEAEVKDPAKAAFLTAFKADLAHPLAFEGPAELSIFPQYGRVVPGSTGDIQWHSSFPGGLVIGVTLQGLVPSHKYILSINGEPQRAGNSNLVDIYRVSPNNIVRYYDFSTITTDVTGSYHAIFGVMLPKSQYDVSFYVKETTDFSIVLYHDFFKFTVE
jgi:hypothetical protein